MFRSVLGAVNYKEIKSTVSDFNIACKAQIIKTPLNPEVWRSTSLFDSFFKVVDLWRLKDEPWKASFGKLNFDLQGSLGGI